MSRFLSTLLVVFLAGCATLRPFRREDPPTGGGIPIGPPAIVLQVSVDERVVDRLLETVRCTEQQASFADPDNPSRQIQFRYHLISTRGDSAQVDFTGPDGIKRRVTVRRGQFADTEIRVDGRRILVQIR
ncbi:MAG TPA: hypothetical protein VFR37_16150 [Longimicrobium sp.]|nr:hypothetical protein [Longimicrobium sp.]